jgi:preprotein translocase subunit SecY
LDGEIDPLDGRTGCGSGARIFTLASIWPSTVAAAQAAPTCGRTSNNIEQHHRTTLSQIQICFCFHLLTDTILIIVSQRSASYKQAGQQVPL